MLEAITAVLQLSGAFLLHVETTPVRVQAWKRHLSRSQQFLPSISCDTHVLCPPWHFAVLGTSSSFRLRDPLPVAVSPPASRLAGSFYHFGSIHQAPREDFPDFT